MNDQYSEPAAPTSDADETARHRSVMMALSALVALLVAAWCLSDGPHIVHGGSVPWVLLAIGIVVGVGLVASGFRRN